MCEELLILTCDISGLEHREDPNAHKVRIHSLFETPRNQKELFAFKSLFSFASKLGIIKIDLIIRNHIEKWIKSFKPTACWYPWIVDQLIPKTKIPSGAMVMDMAWRAYPESFPQPQIAERIFRMNLARADVLFPISSFTDTTIAESFPDLKTRRKIVFHACNPIELDATIVKSKNALPDENLPFFLYPATLSENKNHLTLFSAFNKLLKRGYTSKLILTGGTSVWLRESTFRNSYIERLRSHFQKLPESTREAIVTTGNLPEEKLSHLYQTCISVVLPSWYEGFGLPMIEALERGSQVIASDIPPFREQCSAFGAHEVVHFHRPTDVLQLVNEMESAISRNRSNASFLPVFQKLREWTWADAVKEYIRELDR